MLGVSGLDCLASFRTRVPGVSDRRAEIDVIRHLRKTLHPEIPAMIVAGTTVPERMEPARANGCELLIERVGAERLRAMVHATLGQRAAGGEESRLTSGADPA